VESGAPKKMLRELADRYWDIRTGIGDCKSPETYGAFPMDPYSHTPGHAGARQPGLTGQVKEDIICRFGELGVTVRGGAIQFRPALLRREEFVTGRTEFAYYDVAGVKRRLALKAGELAFTYCQLPIVYRVATKNSVTLVRANGAKDRREDLRLDSTVSQEIFERRSEIARIEVCLNLPLSPRMVE
jgi:hypothetical protein